MGNTLEPGDSALFLLVIKATTDKVLPEMEKFGGTVFQTSLSNEAEANLKKALLLLNRTRTNAGQRSECYFLIQLYRIGKDQVASVPKN